MESRESGAPISVEVIPKGAMSDVTNHSISLRRVVACPRFHRLLWVTFIRTAAVIEKAYTIVFFVRGCIAKRKSMEEYIDVSA